MKKCSRCRKAPRRSPKQRYCKACHAEYTRENRPSYSQLSPEQKKRDCCRSYAGVYLRRGKIERQPCACGAPGTEMHHDDYDKPLEITWMCRPCHLSHHVTH